MFPILSHADSPIATKFVTGIHLILSVVSEQLSSRSHVRLKIDAVNRSDSQTIGPTGTFHNMPPGEKLEGNTDY